MSDEKKPAEKPAEPTPKLSLQDRVRPVSKEERERGYAIRSYVLRGKLVPNYIEVTEDGKLGAFATLDEGWMKKHLARKSTTRKQRR